MVSTHSLPEGGQQPARLKGEILSLLTGNTVHVDRLWIGNNPSDSQWYRISAFLADLLSLLQNQNPDMKWELNWSGL